MNDLISKRGADGWPRVALLLLAAAAALPPAAAQLRAAPRGAAQPAASAPAGATARTAPAAPPSTSRERRQGDYILAVVNQELVTAGELELRLERLRENAARAGNRLPPESELRREVLQSLIDERVLVSTAREAGLRVDDAELDRAVTNVAVQNQITPEQLRERLRQEGIDYNRFRSNLRDQILVERLREREVQSRIRITDAEIAAEIARQRAQAGDAAQYNIAQILVAVPEGADAERVTERRIRAEGALARARAGESFEAIAREVSDDPGKVSGGALGLRPANRLPDSFVAQVRNLQPGEIAPTLLQTGAGFHVLKLLERRDAEAFLVKQTRVRHILLRPSEQLTQQAAIRRLSEIKQRLARGANFETLARENSEDGSAVAGGDLGWTSPGSLVPEFETAMNELAVGGISDPIVSRFGVHLIQVVDRRDVELDARQQREFVRNVLRERKYQTAYENWLDELRARAYVEMREAP